MDLEIPVLARNIPGNAAIIKHKETGLLFSNPQVRKPRILCSFSIRACVCLDAWLFLSAVFPRFSFLELCCCLPCICSSGSSY